MPSARPKSGSCVVKDEMPTTMTEQPVLALVTPHVAVERRGHKLMVAAGAVADRVRLGWHVVTK